MSTDTEIGFAGANTGVDHVIVGQSIMAGTPFGSFMVKDGVDDIWLKA
jgi:hypothetical protein